jgi:hypothetical protein
MAGQVFTGQLFNDQFLKFASWSAIYWADIYWSQLFTGLVRNQLVSCLTGQIFNLVRYVTSPNNYYT